MRRYTAYEAQVWARRQRLGGDVAAKIILMILADYADEWGTCYPGVDRIAEEAEHRIREAHARYDARILATIGEVLAIVFRIKADNRQTCSHILQHLAARLSDALLLGIDADIAHGKDFAE